MSKKKIENHKSVVINDGFIEDGAYGSLVLKNVRDSHHCVDCYYLTGNGIPGWGNKFPGNWVDWGERIFDLGPNFARKIRDRKVWRVVVTPVTTNLIAEILRESIENPIGQESVRCGVIHKPPRRLKHFNSHNLEAEYLNDDVLSEGVYGELKLWHGASRAANGRLTVVYYLSGNDIPGWGSKFPGNWVDWGERIFKLGKATAKKNTTVGVWEITSSGDSNELLKTILPEAIREREKKVEANFERKKSFQSTLSGLHKGLRESYWSSNYPSFLFVPYYLPGASRSLKVIELGVPYPYDEHHKIEAFDIEELDPDASNMELIEALTHIVSIMGDGFAEFIPRLFTSVISTSQEKLDGIVVRGAKLSTTKMLSVRCDSVDNTVVVNIDRIPNKKLNKQGLELDKNNNYENNQKYKPKLDPVLNIDLDWDWK